MEKEKEKEKVKEKEKKTKEQVKVKQTRQKAVNHSLPPNKAKNKKLNKTTAKIGPKTGGGLMAMPQPINPNGAKIVAGRHIIMTG